MNADVGRQLDRAPALNHLPAGFQFGVSSSALGVEGAATVGGRTASIWDAVSAVPGRTADGSTGAIAVDHYHRYPEDVALLARLGVDAYRFSVSWSRVQPGGSGPASAAGLDFYDRLVDHLLEAGIDPWVTIYHWDLPLDLMMEGGWLRRDTASALAELATIVSARLGDRVRHWITMADPILHMGYGHAVGVDAPGLTLLADAVTVTHHLLLGHGLVHQTLRQRSDAAIGIANHHTAVTSAGGSQDDRVAAAIYDAYHNRQFTEPILLGRYPRLLQPLFDRQSKLIRDGDLATISAPLDFYGVNYFHPTTVMAAPENATIPFALTHFEGVARTDYDWPIHPQSLRAVLSDLTRRYPALPPLVVTENGAAFTDLPQTGPDTGDVHPDDARITFLAAHLEAVDDAAADGVDVRGYFHRGLTDAWEASEGFTHQFGLVRVDRESLDRTPRASFDYFRKIIGGYRSTHPKSVKKTGTAAQEPRPAPALPPEE